MQERLQGRLYASRGIIRQQIVRAKGKAGDVSLSFVRGEGKAFLHGKYSVSREGKVVTSGTQIIGKDPKGGLRSWQFERDGGFGEWAWARDGNRWVIEGSGMQPDGEEDTATHLLVPLDKDTFTWQLIERTAGGVVEPGNPPRKRWFDVRPNDAGLQVLRPIE